MITKHKLKIGIGVVVGATALTLLLGGGGFDSKMSSQVKGKYSIAGEKLTMVAKSDPRDRVVVEVGDTVFKPKIKISRWDEVDFSLTLKDNEVGTETVSSKDDKIVWQKGNIETNFYDLPISEANPEGGYEFEVILKEKPLTNKIEFTLQDKDVDYFYQPALTQKEIDEGASRPENVVGSYAVYAKTPKTNWTGGKLYRTGKVGHIFRPKIIDSARTEVWGDLHIENGILSVTIPSDFLDKAVYPVRHAAGLTFGYDTKGGTTSANFSANQLYGTLGTPASSGTVDSITVYGTTTGSARNFKIVLIDGTAKTILTNGVGNTSTINATTPGSWRTATYTIKPSVVASTTYYPSVVIGVSGGTFQKDTGGVTNNFWTDASNSYTTPTDPTDGSGDTDIYSIYATYTAAGGAAAPAPIDDFIIIQPE